MLAYDRISTFSYGDQPFNEETRSVFESAASQFISEGSGSHLASHVVSNVVLSAAPGLTVVFGMGTGVTPGRITTGSLSCHLDT